MVPQSAAERGDVVAVRETLGGLGMFDAAADDHLVLRDLAADSGKTRYVVAWRARAAPANHDIVGAVIDAVGKVAPLSITTSAADELDPAILYARGGTFVVAYDGMVHGLGAERRIGVPMITFGRRRRAPSAASLHEPSSFRVFSARRDLWTASFIRP